MNTCLVHKPRQQWLRPAGLLQTAKSRRLMASATISALFYVWLARLPSLSVVANILKENNTSGISPVCSVGRRLAFCREGSVVEHFRETQSPLGDHSAHQHVKSSQKPYGKRKLVSFYSAAKFSFIRSRLPLFRITLENLIGLN